MFLIEQITGGESRSEGVKGPTPIPFTTDYSMEPSHRFDCARLDLGLPRTCFFRSTWSSPLSQRQCGTGPNDIERRLQRISRPEALPTGSPRLAAVPLLPQHKDAAPTLPAFPFGYADFNVSQL